MATCVYLLTEKKEDDGKTSLTADAHLRADRQPDQWPG